MVRRGKRRNEICIAKSYRLPRPIRPYPRRRYRRRYCRPAVVGSLFHSVKEERSCYPYIYGNDGARYPVKKRRNVGQERDSLLHRGSCFVSRRLVCFARAIECTQKTGRSLPLGPLRRSRPLQSPARFLPTATVARPLQGKGP